MKYLINSVLLGIVGSQLSCTGIDPIDDLFAPPRDYTQEIEFENQGQLQMIAHGFFGQYVDDNRCSPDSLTSDDVANPGDVKHQSFKVRCKMSAHGQAWVDLMKGQRVGTVDFSSPDMAQRLIPGSQIQVMNANGSIRVPLNIVTPSGSGIPNGAWVSLRTHYDDQDRWTLVVPIPAGLAGQDLKIGFPVSSGINSFGNSPVQQQNGYYVSDLPSSTDGFQFSRRLSSGRVRVTCHDSYCDLANY